MSSPPRVAATSAPAPGRSRPSSGRGRCPLRRRGSVAAPHSRTHRTGQVAARYTKAIEQLGSGNLDVRIGGIYALERIAHNSPRDQPAVLEVLAAFIREQRSRAMATERARHGDARADNAPRCTGCGRRNWAPNPQARPGVSLARANFAAANLTGAPWRSDAGVPQGWQQTPTRAAGSRPILARAVRQQTCYASTGLPYLLSGICTGASSRHGMAGGGPGSAT